MTHCEVKINGSLTGKIYWVDFRFKHAAFC